MLDAITAAPGRPLVLTRTNAEDVRAIAYGWSLDVSDLPASPCPSSRVAYGVSITPARLARVDRADVAVRALLAARGVACHNLRVRDLGEAARLEVDGAVEAATAGGAVAVVAGAGFTGSIAIAPFSSAGLNSILPQGCGTHDARKCRACRADSTAGLQVHDTDGGLTWNTAGWDDSDTPVRCSYTERPLSGPSTRTRPMPQ